MCLLVGFRLGCCAQDGAWDREIGYHVIVYETSNSVPIIGFRNSCTYYSPCILSRCVALWVTLHSGSDQATQVLVSSALVLVTFDRVFDAVWCQCGHRSWMMLILGVVSYGHCCGFAVHRRMRSGLLYTSLFPRFLLFVLVSELSELCIRIHMV